MRRGERRAPRHATRGYGLVAVLLLVALTALGLSSVAQSWSEAARREKEQQLLRVGALYVQALERYRRSSPGSDKRLPKELDELLLDQRFVGTVRHLRRLYPDPVNPAGAWGVVRGEDGRIRGVRSLSEDAPLIAGGVVRPGLKLPPAQRYSDWQFVVDSET
jgi:type II secretory pathway pseudopilin PulG